MRRRLSSLRGAWRWSTGHLFRKVGRDGGDGRGSRSFKLLVCFFFFSLLWNCFSRLLRGLLPAPNVSPPPSLLRSLLRSLALSQMVNLNGLLVKSTSTDGFHLETGPLDPPLQFPPPTSSSSSFASPPFLPNPGEKTGLRCRWSDVQELCRPTSTQSFSFPVVDFGSCSFSGSIHRTTSGRLSLFSTTEASARPQRKSSPYYRPTWLRFGLIIAAHETPQCAPIGANLKQKL